MTKQTNEEEKKKIIEAHRRKMSISQASRFSGKSGKTVLKIWRKHGLNPHYQRGYPFLGRHTDIDETIRKCIYSGMSTREAAAEAKVSCETVRTRVPSLGLSFNYVHEISPDTKTSLEYHFIKGTKPSVIAESLGVSRSAVFKYKRMYFDRILSDEKGNQKARDMLMECVSVSSASYRQRLDYAQLMIENVEIPQEIAEAILRRIDPSRPYEGVGALMPREYTDAFLRCRHIYLNNR